MAKICSWCMFLFFSDFIVAQTTQPNIIQEVNGKPALIPVESLQEFDSLPEDRRKLIAEAVGLAKQSPWLPYTARGAAPSDGGFDCSGAMYFVLRRVGLDPPRTSSGQLNWIKRALRLHEVPPGVVDLDHPSMSKLHPGDLLFWGRPGSEGSGEAEEVTHVAMFLGHEKSDKHPVMINSTDGRSYRGVKANGYGVYDFRLPPDGSKICFLGYGSPPGVTQIPNR